MVGNGWVPEGLPEGVRVIALPEDDGIPAGRNAGVAHVRGELLFFLDDDAELAEPDALARVAAQFAADPGLGARQLGVEPRDGGPPPRLGAAPARRRPARARATSRVVWEGAVAMRRDVFEQVGGWPAEFRFVHEGVDLGWRMMDAGYRMRYAGDIAVLHPSTGAGAARVLALFRCAQPRLARAPSPAAAAGRVYVTTFALRTVPRLQSRRARAERGAGVPRRDARSRAGERRRLRAQDPAADDYAPGDPPIM